MYLNFTVKIPEQQLGISKKKIKGTTYILDSRINMTRLVPQLRVLHKSQPA